MMDLKDKINYAANAYALGNFTNKEDLVLIKDAWLDGFNTAIPKWTKADDYLPEVDKNVLIKVKDYRRPNEDVTEVSIGYYNDKWYYDSDDIVDSGHGWYIYEWMEIPQ